MNRKKIQYFDRRISFLWLVVFVLNVSCQGETEGLPDKYPIIPTPQELEFGNEEVSFTAFNLINNDFGAVGLEPQKVMNDSKLWTAKKGLDVEIIQDEKLTEQEGYTLHIDKKITIAASTSKGAFYGLQSLEQLIRKKGKE